MRVGINTGTVVNLSNSVYGDTVNIAARLQGACESGGVLITEPMYEQVREEVKVVKSNRYRLKNMANIIKAYYIESVN